MIAQLFVLLLCVDALIVAIGQGKKRNVWPLIFAYWILLTAKNFCDIMGW